MTAVLSATRRTAASIFQEIITNPAYHDYLAILKGARNGFVYGVKVRFPHALVMAILYTFLSWKCRLRAIINATRQHATNLATFVSCYKILLLLQKKLNGGKQRSADTFIAGMLSGYLVADRSAVNEQIVLYVVSRVVASFLPRASPPAPSVQRPESTSSLTRPIPPDPKHFSLFAAVVWGAVMWLFQNRGETIQPGMFNSMIYLYRDSEVWVDWKTLFLHRQPENSILYFIPQHRHNRGISLVFNLQYIDERFESSKGATQEAQD